MYGACRHGLARGVPYAELTDKIIELAIKIHKKLGSGFVENIYQQALSYEFKKEGMKHTKQKSIDVEYEGILLGGQRVDFITDDKIIVELKAVSKLNYIHQARMIAALIGCAFRKTGQDGKYINLA